MDLLQTLGLAVGSAWLSGINLYATVATLGLLGRYGGVQLPTEMLILTKPIVLGVALTMFVVEFVADKVPYVDSAWDAIHTFIRIPAGAILAYAAVGQVDPQIRLAAILIGGTLALTSHGSKAATRVVANASPEPVSNIALSVAEDGVVVGGTYVATHYAIPMLIFVGVMVLISVLLARKIVRLLKGRSKKASAVA